MKTEERGGGGGQGATFLFKMVSTKADATGEHKKRSSKSSQYSHELFAFSEAANFFLSSYSHSLFHA
jgi:hypothetical protein